MDIKKWYPSTMARPSAKVIKKMIIDSGLEFEGMDYDAMSICQRKRLKRKNLKK